MHNTERQTSANASRVDLGKCPYHNLLVDWTLFSPLIESFYYVVVLGRASTRHIIRRSKSLSWSSHWLERSTTWSIRRWQFYICLPAGDGEPGLNLLVAVCHCASKESVVSVGELKGRFTLLLHCILELYSLPGNNMLKEMQWHQFYFFKGFELLLVLINHCVIHMNNPPFSFFP